MMRCLVVAFGLLFLVAAQACSENQASPPAKPLANATAPVAFASVKAVRNFPATSYQADRQNWAVAEDNRGILYFGNTAGVLEFDQTRWRKIELPGGRGVQSLSKAPDGRIIVGGIGEAGYLAPDAAGTMKYVSQAASLPPAFRSEDNRVIQIIQTPNGQAYLGDLLLFVPNGKGGVSTLRSDDHFLEAAWLDGALYVLDSARGLTRLEGGALKQVAGGEQIRGLAMIVTGSALLIPSFNNGLVRYVPGAANHWQSLSLRGWGSADNYDVTCAVALSDTLYAFGTAKHGVAIVSSAKGLLERVSTSEGLSDSHVYNLTYDRRGGLWLAMNNGLSLVSLNLPDSGPIPFRAWVRKVTGTRDDRVIFGGAYFGVPGGIQQLEQAKAEKLEFPFKYNAFRFAYSANGLEGSGQMEFQTYVEEVDTKWSSWSSRAEREFTELRPGKWVFRVRARKPNGETSEVGTYELRILKAWYDTWWFTIIQVSVVVGLLLLPGHARQMKGLQDGLTTFSVIVPFSYVSAMLSGTLGHYSGGVVFFKVLMSSMISFLLDPIKKRLKKGVEKRNASRLAKAKAKLETPVAKQ
jgi:hypothetical protein